MRVAIVDEDALLREMVESLVARLGYDLVGIAGTTVDGVGLVTAARPDVVTFDMALGYNSDFDVIGASLDVGAQVVIFSHTADAAILSRYPGSLTVVEKPDVVRLEEVLARLGQAEEEPMVVDKERRQRPTRVPPGEPPTGVVDAQAFYEALNDAREGDALVSIELPGDGTRIGEDLLLVMRSTDRLLASSSAVKVFLLGGGDEAITSFLQRLSEAHVIPDGARITAIVVRGGENPMDAFERLKHEGEEQPFPPGS